MEKQLLWNKSFETGIVEFDIHHRNIFNILKILKDAIKNKKSSKIIKYILDEIERYKEYHIDLEEEILRKYHVLSEEHYREHEDFKRKIKEFKEKYVIIHENILAIEISEYLYSWTINHIIKRDMEDIKHLKEKFIEAGKEIPL